MDAGSLADWVGVLTGWIALALSAVSLVASRNFGTKLAGSQNQLRDDIRQEIKGEMAEFRRLESQRVDDATESLTQLTNRLLDILERQTAQGGNRE